MNYDARALDELHRWQARMAAPPGLWSRGTRKLQRRINRVIPQSIHLSITAVIKQMIRAVLAGSNVLTPSPLSDHPLEYREQLAKQKIDRYRRTAAVEGGITGAGGLFLGLTDFPLLLSLKLKLLFDIAGLYGHSTEDYKERIYILYVFQLAFSSDEHRLDTYHRMADWQDRAHFLTSTDELDWQKFQQEYRDYIDLAKLAQLLPVIGAPVGVVVNNRLVRKLGTTAMNAYRMRWFGEHPIGGQAMQN